MVRENAGLRYDEIEPVYLGPADAAFQRGAIDVWSIWEPYASVFATRPEVRTLATNGDIGDQFSFFMGSGPFVRANPALTKTVIETFSETAAKARAHREDLAALLAGATGIPREIWARALAANPLQVLPMNDDLLRSQQKVADRFRALGLLPVDIKVSDITWRTVVAD
jgi:sulfonate transport system substrate-binding protein